MSVKCISVLFIKGCFPPSATAASGVSPRHSRAAWLAVFRWWTVLQLSRWHPAAMASHCSFLRMCLKCLWASFRKYVYYSFNLDWKYSPSSIVYFIRFFLSWNSDDIKAIHQCYFLACQSPLGSFTRSVKWMWQLIGTVWIDGRAGVVVRNNIYW